MKKRNIYHHRVFLYLLQQDATSIYQIKKMRGGNEYEYSKAMDDFIDVGMVERLENKVYTFSKNFMFFREMEGFRIYFKRKEKFILEQVLGNKKYTFAEWITLCFNEIGDIEQALSKKIRGEMLEKIKTDKGELQKAIKKVYP